MADTHLCYVDEPWAYFTDQPLDQQWGDDWNDIPYEHNAETPYSHRGATITVLAYDGPWFTPCWGHLNSPYSVQSINAGAVPWLRELRWIDGSEQAVRSIPAGVTIAEFTELIHAGGGNVYVPVDGGRRG